MMMMMISKLFVSIIQNEEHRVAKNGTWWWRMYKNMKTKYIYLLTSTVISGHGQRPIIAPHITARKDGVGRNIAGGDVTA